MILQMRLGPGQGAVEIVDGAGSDRPRAQLVVRKDPAHRGCGGGRLGAREEGKGRGLGGRRCGLAMRCLAFGYPSPGIVLLHQDRCFVNRLTAAESID